MLTSAPETNSFADSCGSKTPQEYVQHLLAAFHHCRLLWEIGARARNHASRKQGYVIARGVQDWKKSVEFDPAIPHIDQSPLGGRSTEE